MEREKQDRELVQGNCASELGELRERVSYLRSQIEVAEVKIKSQRDEMDDLARSHRTQLGDMEDQIRRCVVGHPSIRCRKTIHPTQHTNIPK